MWGRNTADGRPTSSLNSSSTASPPAAVRYAELLAEAGGTSPTYAPAAYGSAGTNYLFRTRPKAGVIEIVRRSNGSVDGHGIAWPGAPLVEIRAEDDRLYVRSSTHHGWLGRNSKQHWVLATSEPSTTRSPPPRHEDDRMMVRRVAVLQR